MNALRKIIGGIDSGRKKDEKTNLLLTGATYKLNSYRTKKDRRQLAPLLTNLKLSTGAATDRHQRNQMKGALPFAPPNTPKIYVPTNSVSLVDEHPHHESFDRPHNAKERKKPHGGLRIDAVRFSDDTNLPLGVQRRRKPDVAPRPNTYEGHAMSFDTYLRSNGYDVQVTVTPATVAQSTAEESDREEHGQSEEKATETEESTSRPGGNSIDAASKAALEADWERQLLDAREKTKWWLHQQSDFAVATHMPPSNSARRFSVADPQEEIEMRRKTWQIYTPASFRAQGRVRPDTTLDNIAKTSTSGFAGDDDAMEGVVAESPNQTNAEEQYGSGSGHQQTRTGQSAENRSQPSTSGRQARRRRKSNTQAGRSNAAATGGHSSLGKRTRSAEDTGAGASARGPDLLEEPA
ncbi:hypothetical protein BDZ91DRAFT_794389 [Kalaharituber pfeilii]|nr:hypothetical protein BDZ91DRAFT_794389 [Kalaharituber pfeilii]